jgi:hypothetical protein
MIKRQLSQLVLLAAAAWFSAGLAVAGPVPIDRALKKEPVYRTKKPTYGLLLFGPQGKDRVWLVRDGNTLYVDRNGNGDLTEPGEKVEAEKQAGPSSDEEGYTFEVGDITVGGRTHRGLKVLFGALKELAATSIGKRPDVQAALARDPHAMAAAIQVDIQVDGLKGGGLGGRVQYQAGPIDLTGVYQFAARPADAPAVHLGGPLEVTFWGDLPTLRVGRSTELMLVVGTPGTGPGTFAMVAYSGTVPKDARPMARVSLPPAKPGAPPLEGKWGIKGRC